MELNISELKDACFQVARNTLWKMKPVDLSEIQFHAEKLYKIAMRHIELLQESGEDPNLVIRAVHYLEQTHAIPPVGKDTRWFDNTLEALIELACPNSILRNEGFAFLDDLIKGIRKHYKDQET